MLVAWMMGGFGDHWRIGTGIVVAGRCLVLRLICSKCPALSYVVAIEPSLAGVCRVSDGSLLPL